MADLIRREDNSGALAKQDFVTSLIANLTEKRQVAEIMLKSGFMPPAYNSADKILVTMFKCQELSIPLMEGISSIAIVNNKPTLQGNLLLALINRSGKCKKMQFDSTDTYCKVTMARKDYELEHTETFTLKDAQAAGLTGKDIWKKYTKIMLKWRAVANCARTVFPELLSGLYLPEEIASIDNTPIEVDETGNVEVVEPTTKTAPNAKSAYYEAIMAEPAQEVTKSEEVKQPENAEKTSEVSKPVIKVEEEKVDADVVNLISASRTVEELLDIFNRIPQDKRASYLKYLSLRKAEIKEEIRNSMKLSQELRQAILAIDNAVDYFTQEPVLTQKIQMSGLTSALKSELFNALEELDKKWNVLQ